MSLSNDVRFTMSDLDRIMPSLTETVRLAKKLQTIQSETRQLEQERDVAMEAIKLKLGDVSIEEAKSILKERSAKVLEKKAKIQEKEARIQEKEARIEEKEARIQEKKANLLEEKAILTKKKEEVQAQKNNLAEQKKEIDNVLKEKVDTKFSQIFGEKPAETVSFIGINREKVRLDLLMDPFVDFLKKNPGFTKINLTGFKEEIEDKDIQKLANYILFEKNTLATVVVVEGLKSRKIILSNLSNDQKTQLKTIALDKLTFNDLKALAKALSNKTIDIKSPPPKKV